MLKLPWSRTCWLISEPFGHAQIEPRQAIVVHRLRRDQRNRGGGRARNPGPASCQVAAQRRRDQGVRCRIARRDRRPGDVLEHGAHHEVGGNGHVRNPLNCVWPLNGVTIRQIRWPLMVVRVNGVGVESMPAVSPTRLPGRPAVDAPGESTSKQASFTLRPCPRRRRTECPSQAAR